MADTQRSAYERVQLARSKDRPNIQDYIDHLFTDFFEQRGDRASMDDGSIVGGIAMLGDRPVTVIGHRKGKTLEENVRCNFGMPQPEGYRKSLRLMREVGEGTPLGRVLGSGAGITGKVFGCLRVPVAKNQAMPAYDPRAVKGVGVTYAVSPQGADHTSGNTVKSPVKQHLKDGQETVSRNAQVGFTVMDNLGLCILASGGIGDLGVVADLLKARWGVETTPERLRREAWETVLLERGFNRRAGFTPAHDRLPEFFEEEINPANGQVFDVPEDTLRRVYDEPPA